MREAFVRYIAPDGNIVGQALRLPTMSYASNARALQSESVSKSRSEFFGRSN